MIGTLAEKAFAAGFTVAIVTMDKDFFQLVRDGIRVFNPRDEGTWFDAAGVKEKFGVAPEQVVDVLALMGDTIDNIKGVPGIGDKGARELIATYGTLDNLLSHAGEIKNKRYREGLLGHADAARQSQSLARIRTDVPVEFDPAALTYRGGSRQRSFEIFNELGFRALAKEYAPTAATTARSYRAVNDAAGVSGPGRSADVRGKLRAARDCRTAPPRCAPASSAWRSPPRRGTLTTCRSDTAGSATWSRCRSAWRSTRCGRSSRTSRSGRSATI